MSDTITEAKASPYRASTYYWKSDRPAAFHGSASKVRNLSLQAELQGNLEKRFNAPVKLKEAGGQGNHVTFLMEMNGEISFVRVEDGPERDDYLEVESFVQNSVRSLGIPTPRILAVDASRADSGFAWQVMDYDAHPDLNHWYKLGELDLVATAREIGAGVARWQSIRPEGFGPFQAGAVREEQVLRGFHQKYRSYFFLHLERHLAFLTDNDFIGRAFAREISETIQSHGGLLDLAEGCLVHKDLALWNMLGSQTKISSYIDWDDAISGDSMDDLSLLGCFYDGEMVESAIAGYLSIRALPEEHVARFWLHLLRNMIVKSVIRVGAGYFQRGENFYLIGNGSKGSDLRAFTSGRLQTALSGLKGNLPFTTLQNS